LLSSLHSYHTDKLIQPMFWLLMICLSLSPKPVKAQNTEIGIEMGSYSYLGDVTRSYQLSSNSLGGQFFIRKHVDDGLSVRFSIGAGQLEGADDEAFDVFSANRRASFQGDFFNTDMLFEYHFLDYRNPKLDQSWTPYLLFGVGVYQFEGQDQLSNVYSSGIRFRMPVGVGIKLKIDRRWTLGVSASAIKTNSDVLDNVSLATPNIKDYRGGNPNDDDVMFFTGFSLSYTFFKIVCPKPFF